MLKRKVRHKSSWHLILSVMLISTWLILTDTASIFLLPQIYLIKRVEALSIYFYILFSCSKNRFLSPFKKWMGREVIRHSCSICQSVQGDILGRRKLVFLKSSQQNATVAQHLEASSSMGSEDDCTKDSFVRTVIKEIPSFIFFSLFKYKSGYSTIVFMYPQN